MPIISIYNNKGGDGKSTVTVGLAEFLSANLKQSVLVIDLDAQASSSGALLGQKAVSEAIAQKKTIAELTREIRTHRQPANDLDKYLISRHGSGSRGMALKDLSVIVPDAEGMFNLEETMDWRKESALFQSHLRQALLDRFDYVLIDHPGSLKKDSVISVNGLAMSDYVLIPVRPARISLGGLKLTFEMIDHARDVSGTSAPRILGLLRNETDRRTQQYRQNFPALIDASNSGELPPIFENFWPHSPALETATDASRESRTLKDRFGEAYEPVRKVAVELTKRCNGEAPEIVRPSIWRRVLQSVGLA